MTFNIAFDLITFTYSTVHFYACETSRSHTQPPFSPFDAGSLTEKRPNAGESYPGKLPESTNACMQWNLYRITMKSIARKHIEFHNPKVIFQNIKFWCRNIAICDHINFNVTINKNTVSSFWY